MSLSAGHAGVVKYRNCVVVLLISVDGSSERARGQLCAIGAVTRRVKDLCESGIILASVWRVIVLKGYAHFCAGEFNGAR